MLAKGCAPLSKINNDAPDQWFVLITHRCGTEAHGILVDSVDQWKRDVSRPTPFFSTMLRDLYLSSISTSNGFRSSRHRFS